MGREDEMKALADALWAYIEPKIEKKLRDCVRFYRATITTAAANGVMGVTAPYGTEVFLPYVGSASGLAVNSQCVVAEFGSASNAVVIGDGMISNL